MKNNVYSLSQGTRFGTSPSLIGVMAIVIGIIAILIPYYIIGVVFILTGGVIAFDSYGLEFNIEEKTFRRYDKFIFFNQLFSIKN